MEVVLALGVTSFVLMALLGTLPAGVKSVKDSMNDSARANILQQIRANLEEVSFGASSAAANNIDTTLSGQTNYFSADGLLLVSSGSSIPSGAYYQATFAASSATYPNSTTQFQYGSAQNVQVILAYPVYAPLASQTQMTNYIFAAKQKNY